MNFCCEDFFFGLGFALYNMKKKIITKKENCYEEDQSFFSTFILLNDWFKKSSVFIMFYKGYPLDTFQAGI